MDQFANGMWVSLRMCGDQNVTHSLDQLVIEIVDTVPRQHQWHRFEVVI
jgi:hypothetical protein